MNPIQVKAVPAELQSSLPQLIRDLKAALSYVSFYSSDSPFVVQAVSKSHRDLQKFIEACNSVVLRLDDGRIFLNDADISEVGDLPKIFQEKKIRGAVFLPGLTPVELTSWIKAVTLPVHDPSTEAQESSHIRPLSRDVEIVFWKEEIPTPSGPVRVGNWVAAPTEGSPELSPAEATEPVSTGPIPVEGLST